MRKIKGFNFDAVKDKELLDHIAKQQNQSVYIKELVRKDMEDQDIEMIIERYIKKYMSQDKYQLKEEQEDFNKDDVFNLLDQMN